MTPEEKHRSLIQRTNTLETLRRTGDVPREIINGQIEAVAQAFVRYLAIFLPEAEEE